MDYNDSEKYVHMLTDYLIDCCLWSEFAVQRTSSYEFHKRRIEIYNHWDEITHHHKYVVGTKDNLFLYPVMEHIRFPTMVRSICCGIARKMPNNPMSGRDTSFIHKYVADMMCNPNQPNA